jgi:hypothetical protein
VLVDRNSRYVVTEIVVHLIEILTLHFACSYL